MWSAVPSDRAKREMLLAASEGAWLHPDAPEEQNRRRELVRALVKELVKAATALEDARNNAEFLTNRSASYAAMDPSLGLGPFTNSQHDQSHSISSSARKSNEGGTVRPSASAVFMLIARWYLVGCSTGRSEGLAPLRILST